MVTGQIRHTLEQHEIWVKSFFERFGVVEETLRGKRSELASRKRVFRTIKERSDH